LSERAVLADSVREEADRLMQEFPADENLRDGMIRLGIQYLTGRLAAIPIGNLRILANQPEAARLGIEFYESVLKPSWDRFAQRLAALMEEGRLDRADPWTAAMHWKGLNEGELLEKCLLGAAPSLDGAEIEKVATAATNAFLKIYEPIA